MDEKLLSALIGGVAGAIISLISSYIITKLKIKQELRTWNSDFAVNYSKLLFENPKAAVQLARQFSIGLIIVKDHEGKTKGKYFIPYQCKVSVGRMDDNDIVLDDMTVSRDHGVFFFRGHRVYYQDFAPLNQTLINGKKIDKIKRLNTGDKLIVGNTIMEFEELK